MNLYIIDADDDCTTLVLTVVAQTETEALNMAREHCRNADDDASCVPEEEIRVVETYKLKPGRNTPGVKKRWVHSG